jgi:hypothetical protein
MFFGGKGIKFIELLFCSHRALRPVKKIIFLDHFSEERATVNFKFIMEKLYK